MSLLTTFIPLSIKINMILHLFTIVEYSTSTIVASSSVNGGAICTFYSMYAEGNNIAILSKNTTSNSTFINYLYFNSINSTWSNISLTNVVNKYSTDKIRTYILNTNLSYTSFLTYNNSHMYYYSSANNLVPVLMYSQNDTNLIQIYDACFNNIDNTIIFILMTYNVGIGPTYHVKMINTSDSAIYSLFNTNIVCSNGLAKLYYKGNRILVQL